MIGEKIIEALEKAHQEEVQAAKDARLSAGDVNHPSDLGWADDCLRYLTLVRLAPKAAASSPQQDRIFAEGRKQETIFRSEMDASGWETSKAPTMQIDELLLRGTADLMVKHEGVSVPADFKSCSEQMFRRVKKMKSANDLFAARQIWLRHYPAQLWGYMMLYDAPVGLLLFRSKMDGEKHFIEIPREGREIDRYVEALQTVNSMVKGGKPGDKIDQEETCSRCPFAGYCYPDEAPKTAAQRLQDEEIEILLERRAQLETAAKEFKEADEAIKERFEGQDGAWRIGDFLIENHPFKTTTYKVPDEIKKQYAVQESRNRVKIKGLLEAL